jgi:hypothetical protein
MAISIAGEIPALVLVYFTIDKESIGRKKGQVVVIIILFVLNLLIYFLKESFLVIGYFWIHFFCRIMDKSLTTMMMECYPTNYRTIAMGYAWAIGRLGGFICKQLFTNIILILLFNIKLHLLFMLFICTINFILL